LSGKSVAEPRCSNGIHCVAYPALGEPSKLSRSNPETRCFACEERRASSTLTREAAKARKAATLQDANELRWSKSNTVEEHAEASRAYFVLERRRKTVLTCERGLRSAKASGDERLVRRWSRALRDAEERLAWAEADFERARSATR
jgi:hypothetical protein